MSYAFASIEHNGKVVPAVQAGGRYWPLASAAAALGIDQLPGSLVEIFKNWTEHQEAATRVGDAILSGEISLKMSVGAEVVELSIPLEYPPKVFCTGANYADHLAEMGVKMDKVQGRPPFFYMKPPSTSLTGPGKTVHIPPDCEDFDWEVEVVMVFGRGGRNIPMDSALDYIAGYTLGIDFTARDKFFAPHLPFNFDFALGKCQDSTAPIGPVIVPKQFVNLEDIPFTLSVNGVKKQDSTTSRMVYSLAEQISGISRAVRIEPGDILFTGSPAGVGAAKGEKLQAGDIVVVETQLTGPMEIIIQSPLRGFSASR